MRRLLVGFAFVILLAACNDGVSVAPATLPTTTLPSTTLPSTTLPTTTTPASTTAPPPATAVPTTSTAVPATTSSLRSPELDHEGSPMLRFAVRLGEGVDGTTLDELTRFVVDTLGDGRGWISRGAGFEFVTDPDVAVDVTIVVALPDEVDRLCAPLQTNGRFSCGRNGWVAINADRWFGATATWPGDLETYRRYLVNHEVGHYLVGAGHDVCPGAGEPAPIMMQQTKGLDGCLPNGWVLPDA